MNGARVSGLRVTLGGTRFDIVDEIAFTIAPGRILGVVGESGSGKTTVGQAMLGFCRAGAAIAGGAVVVGGQDVLAPDAPLEDLRGRVVAYVPQDPGTALNPALRVGEQLEEMLVRHCPVLDRPARALQMDAALADVSLPPGPATLTN